MSAPIRVLLAEDHPVVRVGIRTLLERDPGLAIVGEAGDGQTALRLARELLPDVLVLDMELPVVAGVEVARQLRDLGSAVRVLALSAYDDAYYVQGLLACGAAGYLTKDEAPQTIVEAVRAVATTGAVWLGRRSAARLLAAEDAPAHQVPPPLAALSARERQVLRLLARGRSNEEVAASLHLAEGTVKNHATTIYGKLGVRTRAEVVAWAWQQGLMADPAEGPTAG